MKKLTTLLLFAITYTSFAQIKLINPSKVWSVQYDLYGSSPTPLDSILSLYYFGNDTVVAGKTYTRLIEVVDTNTFIENNIGYMREDSNGNVFGLKTYNLNQEFAMYNFNLVAGDTISTNGLAWTSAPADWLYVDSVNYAPIPSGEIRKHIYLRWLAANWNVEWIEGIGSTLGVGMSGGMVMDVLPHLLCFREKDTVKYFTPNSDCFFSAAGLDVQLLKSDLTVMPNPFDNFINVAIDGDISKLNCTLYNVLGKQQNINIATDLSGFKITFNTKMEPGIYFLKIANGNQELIKRVVKL